MLKDKIKGAVIGLLVGSTLTGGIAFAKTGSQMIEAVYSDIKIYVNGNKVNTSSNEPFIYNGTTYLPVRAIGEALGQSVNWDGNTKSVYIGSYANNTQYLMDVCPPYEKSGYKDGKSFYMSGQLYNNGFILYNTGGGYAMINLNKKYSHVNLTVGHVDGSGMHDANVSFYVDGKLIKEITVGADEMPQTVSIPVNYASQFKIVTAKTTSNYTSGYVGFGNITVE